MSVRFLRADVIMTASISDSNEGPPKERENPNHGTVCREEESMRAKAAPSFKNPEPAIYPEEPPLR
jgi:hypothetical protein